MCCGNSVPDITLINFDAIFFAQPPKLVLKTLSPMMLFLVQYVLLQLIDMRRADRERAVPALPMELRRAWLFGLDPL